MTRLIDRTVALFANAKNRVRRIVRVFFSFNRIYLFTVLMLFVSSFSSVYLGNLRITYESQNSALQRLHFDAERLQSIVNSNIYETATPLSKYENLIKNIFFDVQNISQGSNNFPKIESEFTQSFVESGTEWYNSLRVIVNRFNNINKIRKANDGIRNDIEVLTSHLSDFRQSERKQSAELNEHISTLLLIGQFRDAVLRADISADASGEEVRSIATSYAKETESLTAALDSISGFISSNLFREFISFADGSSGRPDSRYPLSGDEIVPLYESLRKNIVDFESILRDITQVNLTIVSSEKINFKFVKDYNRLIQVVSDRYETANLFYLLSFLLWIVVIILGILSYYVYVNELNRRTERLRRENEDLTNSVLSLTNEISEYASGNLIKDIPVTSSMTGSIADSINLVIQSMRNIISTIKKNSIEVSELTEQNITLSGEIQQLTSQQISSILQSRDDLTTLSSEIDQVASDARTIEQAAGDAQQLNRQSTASIGASINSIDFIRSDIQNTSRRLKHLGESSQKIGEIVALLTDIAKQTKLVALNASIQITSKGDSGYGMIGVVEETQKLANLVADSAQQASEIVVSIQRETSKTIEAMEQFTSKVVEEYEKAKEAKLSLDTINDAYDALLSDINSIVAQIVATSNRTQAVSKQVFEIADVSRKISGSIEKSDTNSKSLTEKVGLLVKSVSIFSLPELGEEYDDGSSFIEDDF